MIRRTTFIAVIAAMSGLVVPTAGAAATVERAPASKGCGRPAPSGVTTENIDVGGQPRQYLLEVPPSYRPRRATALVFNFHGLGSSMRQQAAYSGLNAKGAKAGDVVITPNGSGGALRTWRFAPFPGNDVPFVLAVLGRIESTFCIDPHRVFATGISAGGIFSTSLACAMPGTFAAIAPVAGINATRVCAPGTPRVSVLAFHGTADPVVPYAGGPYFSGLRRSPRSGRSSSTTTPSGTTEQDRLRAQFGVGDAATVVLGEHARARPVRTAIAGWAAFDGCGTRPKVRRVDRDVTTTTERRCRDHSAVQLYTVHGGGHTWPGAKHVARPRLGKVTESIDASDLMLAFFAAHPARG